jgi:excinuclease ABC subunit B
VFCSATPGPYECAQASTVAEQVIRPTGLLDPVVEIRPLDGQIDDLIAEIRRVVSPEDGASGDRVLVTTLTKRSSEDLTQYLREIGVRVEYLHSDLDAITRVETLSRLRQGAFDVLVGINLLREGLDLPEVALVAILDADKEGFLRSATSLVQTAGRAARHVNGRVVLYADRRTDAIDELLRLTADHRARQEAYNRENGIVPRAVRRGINEASHLFRAGGSAVEPARAAADDVRETIAEMTREMLQAADDLAFERAAYLRDAIAELKRTARKGKRP